MVAAGCIVEADHAAAWLVNCDHQSNLQSSIGPFQVNAALLRKNAKMRCFLAAILVLSAPITSASATSYTFTTLNGPYGFNETYGTEASAINNAGQVVVSYNFNSFLYNSASGSYSLIPPPPSALSFIAYGINDAGAIVGSIAFTYTIGNNYSFLRDASGPFTYFAPTYAASSTADGINASGQIVGYQANSSRSQPLTTSYLRNIDGSLVTIYDPKSTVSFYSGNNVATSINNAGLVIGNYYNNVAPDSGSFLFNSSTGTYTEFNDPASTFTAARGINNVGQVVGSIYDTSLQAYTGFVLDLATGVYTSFADPDGVSTSAQAINDRGQIVGTFTDAAGFLHPFLATPTASAVPEPSSLVLLGGVAASVGFFRRRTR